ncbi:MAG: hypothetical protein ACLFQG_04980 [Desulfovermiculus sp.]
MAYKLISVFCPPLDLGKRAMHRLHLPPGARDLDVCAGNEGFALLAARAAGPPDSTVLNMICNSSSLSLISLSFYF